MRAIPPKIHILRFIGEQGIASVADVTHHLFEPQKFHAVRIALHKLGVSHTQYPGIRHGIWFINKPELYSLLSNYFPHLPAFQVRPIPLHLVLHYLELNRIRTALQKSNQFVIDEWWSETYIRALPFVVRSRISGIKIPDAIFWRRRKDGGRRQFFLEYERTLKNKERYKEIFCSYAKRQGVEGRNVLYICSTEAIREELLAIEARLAQMGKLEGRGLHFQFVTLESFYKTYGDPQTKKEAGNEGNHAIEKDF